MGIKTNHKGTKGTKKKGHKDEKTGIEPRMDTE
jgi:hypothetical protein